MTLLYFDPIFLEHRTGDHPESPDRILPAIDQLSCTGLGAAYQRPAWQPVSTDRLAYVHDEDYIKSVQQYADAGGGYLDSDTVVSKRSYEAAIHATGAVCDATERVIRAEDTNAFCLVRPPGHHAMPDHATGFCLFNHIAVAARVATNELGIDRVLIVDFDVHHGNGTQATFYDSGDVGYFSIHRSPFYPNTGFASDIGEGNGRGMTMNVPIRFGESRTDQIDRFRQTVNSFADHVQPQLVMVSAGFDAHKEDPIGSLGWESEDFRTVTRLLLDIASKHACGRLVSVLEGGYNAEAVAECIAIHLEELGG
ncbi:histone deacetylase family protein [Rubripirellula reticaptiva]|uniref:Histone deacetylase-like amidohydrolase n=1 Tax=Rubripirellula reticaptiva TaxID=2528013 RepID=A0A5C6EDU6_9BACT|nr:histone deacetylase [Rubripirellula reticaptiva]TWU46655.1 Histone deacetylase-like amidohydrolase [Rubripirellula reticaptiva]